MKKSKIDMLRMELSQEVPYFETDLFRNLDELLEHIKMLVENNTMIHFLISDWYDIGVQADRFRLIEDSEKCVVLEFYKKNECINRMIMPKDKMYRVGASKQYIEIIEGIDYSVDDHFGDCYRVN